MRAKLKWSDKGVVNMDVSKLKERVIIAFLEGGTISEIARNSGLSERTVVRYRADKDFKDYINSYRRESLKEAVGILQQNLTTGATELCNIIKAAEVPPQVRVQAIQVLMNQAKNWTMEIDNISRLDSLEEKLRELEKV